MWDPISDDCGEWGGEGGRIALHGQPGPHWENTFVTKADDDDKLKCGEWDYKPSLVNNPWTTRITIICEHTFIIPNIENTYEDLQRHVCIHLCKQMGFMRSLLDIFAQPSIVVKSRLEKIKVWNAAISSRNQTRPLLCAGRLGKHSSWNSIMSNDGDQVWK